MRVSLCGSMEEIDVSPVCRACWCLGAGGGDTVPMPESVDDVHSVVKRMELHGQRSWKAYVF